MPVHEPLRFGVVLDWVYGREVDPARQIEEHRELLEEGRRWGMSLFTSGQHFLPEGMRFFQPVPYLAAMSQHFPEMRVATAVLLLPLLNPIQVAEEMATLDAVTGGRAICGVGLGYTDKEFELFGVRRKDRVARVEEALEVVRAIWSGKPIDHHGDFFSLRSDPSAVLPVQQTGPPVWLGGGAEASALRAARCADAFYPPPFVSHTELRRLCLLHHSTRVALGRGAPATVPIRRDLYIADSRAEAAQRIEPFVNGRTRTYMKWGMANESNEAAVFREDTADELGQRLLLGSPGDIAVGLSSLRNDVGMTDFVLRLQWPGMEHGEALAQMRRFGEEVLPLVA